MIWPFAMWNCPVPPLPPLPPLPPQLSIWDWVQTVESTGFAPGPSQLVPLHAYQLPDDASRPQIVPDASVSPDVPAPPGTGLPLSSITPAAVSVQTLPPASVIDPPLVVVSTI